MPKANTLVGRIVRLTRPIPTRGYLLRVGEQLRVVRDDGVWLDVEDPNDRQRRALGVPRKSVAPLDD